MDNVLGKQNALELNQEEVEQLGEILEHGFGGLLRDGIVAARSEGTSNALLKDNMASNLDSGGHCGAYRVSRELELLITPSVTRPTYIPTTCTGT